MDIKGERMLEERYEPEGKLAQHLITPNALQRLPHLFGGKRGSFVSGTATIPFPLFFRVTEVGTISISRRPSPARISSSWPGFRPRACLSGLGTTIRPAASMVAFMAW